MKDVVKKKKLTCTAFEDENPPEIEQSDNEEKTLTMMIVLIKRTRRSGSRGFIVMKLGIVTLVIHA